MVHLKRILFSLCAMIVVVSGIIGLTRAQAQQKHDPEKPQTWLTYTVKGGEFAVALPDSPEMTDTKTFNRPLRKTLLGRLLKTTHNRVVYSIEVYENVEPKVSLHQYVAEETTESRFDVTTEMNLVVDGFAGKEFSSKSTLLREMVQFFATDQRLYRFAVSGADAKHAGVQRFFSSIRLGPETAGIEVSEPPKDPLEIDGERIFTGKEVDVKVKFILRPDAEYTQAARMKGISGTVKLKAVCSANGQVKHIQVIRGLPFGLTEQAMRAASRIRFTPAMKGGKPVAMWMQFDYSFNLF